MRTYSVMLVDDEKAVRRAIARKLEWEEIGFEMIALAENGEEALELAEKLQPDVVLTDIKMPFMDGLTLCKKLKQMQKNIKVIVFSGFDEFEYAKEAIHLGAEDYILKPIDSDELRNVFLKIKDVLNKEHEEKRNLDKLNEYYRKSLPKMKEQFIMGLLEGTIQEERIDEMNTDYEVYLTSPFYAAVVFQMDAEEKESWKLSKKELLALSLKQIIDENMSHAFQIYSMVHLDMVVVIMLLKGRGYFNRAAREIDQICKLARKILEVHVTAGLGQVVEGLAELNQSWKGALGAVDYRMFLKPDRAICISDIQRGEDDNFVAVEQIVSRLVKDIKLGEEQDLEQDVDALIGQLEDNKISLHKYQIIVTEIVVELLKLARTYHVKPESLFGGKIDNFYRDMRKFVSLDEMRQWLRKLCLDLRESIRRERKDSAKLLVESAKQFIHENYGDSTISVETLCGHLNVSAAYFSTIFKRETGKSFVTYLTEVRMEAARELLNNTEDKTYIISAKVGYTEPNYFSYVFKKQYGIAPSKYRMEKIENHDKEN